MKQFKHAALMLWRNLRSYGMLSVTIVLSFSLMLGYLAFMDSDLYNQYKYILAGDPNVVMTYTWESTGHNALQAMTKKTDPDAQIYQYYCYDGKLSQFGDIFAKITFLPYADVPVHRLRMVLGDRYGNAYNDSVPITITQGKQSFLLEQNEAIVDETLFRSLSPDGTLPVSLTIPIEWSDLSVSYYTVEVVGVCSQQGALYADENGQQQGQCYIYVSQSMLGDRSVQEIGAVQWITWMYTQHPNELVDYAKSLDMVVHAICQEQEEAIQQLQAKTGTKGAVAAVLLLLLGINLYSSFSNALNGRKYEIGVKRAIGASAGHILLQFLLESLLVMLVNILLSILLVADALSIYKLYVLLTEEYQWVVDVSIYSVAMFLVCGVTLTVVFSLLFAYKSTQVEIVQYLKAE